jgi:hypothetical protein
MHIGYVSQLLSADGSLTTWETLLLSARPATCRRLQRLLRPRYCDSTPRWSNGLCLHQTGDGLVG